MKPLGLGMIGLHHQHPRWYRPLWEHLGQYRPLAVAEADEAFGAEENGFFRLDAYGDYRQLLRREDIDVVIIWLPHDEMPDAVAAAAAAGKHVIVEKPAAADLAGARKIVATADRHPDIKISSPYCWRTHPVSERIRAAVDGGLLGKIVAMEGRLNAGTAQRYIRDKSPWMLSAAAGGGPMWNLGVHWIDYFRWLTRQEVVRVAGTVSSLAGGPQRDIEDNAQALLTFADGATAVIDVSYSLPQAYPGKRDIFVAARGEIGDLAWAPAWESVTDELLLVSEHPSAGDERCRKLQIVSKDIPGYCGHMAWAWLGDFAAAVRENREPLVTPADMLAAVKVADAFYRSVRSGRAEAPAKE